MKKHIVKGYKNGFILVEGIIGTIISFEAILIVFLIFSSFKNSPNNNMISFYRYLNLIESDHFNFKLKSIHENNVQFFSEKENKLYRLEKYKNMIRLTGESLGHVPLILNVKDVKWSGSSQNCRTKVVFENGQKYSANSRF